MAGPSSLTFLAKQISRSPLTIDDYLLTPTLLPNLLRATRAALFPGNARPTPTPNRGQGGALAARAGVRVPAISSSASFPSPHVPVQAATPPPAEGVSVPSNATDKSNTAAPVSTPSELETATIKRRCAIGILSLIPRPVARSFWSPSVNIHNSTRSYDRNADPDANLNDNANDDNANTNNAPPELNNSNLDNPSMSNPVKDGNQTDSEEETILQTIESDILDLFADEYCNKHLIYAIIERILIRLLPELQEKSVGELLEDRGVGLSPG
ncbi:hypothetical protein PHISCL_08709 [Aspergillus sclerotialis]|uniref:PXA domain-containing protein n=1 Tax=Aspergillus sclerotialis TaxID=2070753 RepID=A0A3A2Z784_9EURO|nr:hypothetical protein PHISCL_08709 [Aspergillus sclerotialis]